MKRDKFAQKIRELREALDLTQDQLAAKCGITSRTIGAVERGRGCNLRTLQALAKGLEVDSFKLLHEDPTP
jgi:transcriptional regulator with XRE-family HTH domain